MWTLSLVAVFEMLCSGTQFIELAGTGTGNTDHGIAYPEIGVWYRRENGSLFEVVAVDEEDGTVEIQYFDATIEEVELDRWQKLKLESAFPPEDWSGAVDVDFEDLPESEIQSRNTAQSQLIILDRYE